MDLLANLKYIVLFSTLLPNFISLFHYFNLLVVKMLQMIVLIGCLITQSATKDPSIECSVEINTQTFSKHVIPTLEGKHKGESGKIGVIGGSTEYTGAPYFAAISALKAGADLAYVITTESAAPVIKSYSPELIVYPFLHSTHFLKIIDLLKKMDVVVIGPGLGREQATMSLVYEIIQYCEALRKPLVIDADGLYAVSKNISVIMKYPSPGIILTPNHAEADKLKSSIPITINTTTLDWYNFWGENVAVLIKGREDTFYSGISSYGWRITEGGSARRCGGQRDILAGVLGPFFKWSINSTLCSDHNGSGSSNHKLSPLARSLAANAAAHFTRRCNLLAFNKYGRSMTASDMLEKIHNAFDLFNY